MKKTTRNTGFRVAMIILTALSISFAFINSLMPSSVSSQESSAVMVFLQNMFSVFNVNAALTEYTIRKIAHFTEYSVIGAMLMNTAYSFNKARPYKYLTTIYFVGLFSAVIDERIQFYVPGRVSDVYDVFIDFSGVIFGSLVMLLILTIYKKIRKI